MLHAFYQKITFQFKRPSGTSRGIMRERDSWFLCIRDEKLPVIIGIGECAPLPGLSVDDPEQFEPVLKELCQDINNWKSWLNGRLTSFPAIRFGLEVALRDLKNRGSKILFDSGFTERNEPIAINGLIWMGSSAYMCEQVEAKLEQGFRCIKMKIGAINFEEEIKLLRDIRKAFTAEQVELRVDANGAFAPEEAREKMKRLAEFELHSIEQPIASGQWDRMARLCERAPLPVALDEELIGVNGLKNKEALLDTIRPQYLVFKPSLLGGFAACEQWIELATSRGIDWWVTSALESNVGLSAIAQWTATLNNPLPQGLGTGQLYTNNIPSPLLLENGSLYFGFNSDWELNPLFNAQP